MTTKPHTYTSQQILNLAFVEATSKLATPGSLVSFNQGDGGGMTYTEQEIWNRVFDNTNSVINLSLA